MKLLVAASKQQDLPHEEKVRLLKEKFIERQLEFDVRNTGLIHTFNFAAEAVIRVLRKMPRQAASCIERWSSTMLLQAIEVRPTIADYMGRICAMINDGVFGKLILDIIRFSRVVGIPKSDTSVRPIALSCFFAKLTGGLVFDATKPGCSPQQFAIGGKNGAEKIVHHTRDEYNDGKAVIRIDIENAFGTAQRSRIADILNEFNANGKLALVRRYFNVIYGPSSHLVVFGPRGRSITLLDFNEGVRQGDIFSSYFFCLMMDKVIKDIMSSEIATLDGSIQIRAYMDDITITANPAIALRVADVAVQCLRSNGFRPSIAKSKILVANRTLLQQRALPDAASSAFEICDDTSTFVVLGANMTSHFNEFNEKQRQRNRAFFNCLRNVDLHPHLGYIIARLCGSPRLQYYASTTPPQFSRDVVTEFQRDLVQYVQGILNFEIPQQVLHERYGAGLPNYVANIEALYKFSREMALHHVDVVRPALVTNLSIDGNVDELTAHLRDQHSAEWLFFQPADSEDHLEPREFRIAMAMRCRTLPSNVRNNIRRGRCDCNETPEGVEGLIDHALVCRSAPYTNTHRHTAVKYAIARVLNEFGVERNIEPNFYRYRDGHQRRPDICAHGSPPVATDIVICKREGKTGDHAAREAAVKRQSHEAAVHATGHVFIPFAAEAHGHLDNSALKFTEHVSETLKSYQQKEFRKKMTRSVATALAKSRVRAVLAMPMLAGTLLA